MLNTAMKSFFYVVWMKFILVVLEKEWHLQWLKLVPTERTHSHNIYSYYFTFASSTGYRSPHDFLLLLHFDKYQRKNRKANINNSWCWNYMKALSALLVSLYRGTAQTAARRTSNVELCIKISWHGNISHITDPLCGESTSHWWILITNGQ